MEFIDHTGHIFSLPSYDEYPIGYEYNTNDYIFWIDNEYTGKLSTGIYYMKAIRPLLYNATIQELCNSSNIIEYNPETKVEYDNNVTGKKEEVTVKHKIEIKDKRKKIVDIHISVDSKHYKLVASKQIQELVASNKSMNEYISIDGDNDSKVSLSMNDISIVDELTDNDKWFAMIPFYVIGCCNEEGTWMTNVLINVKYADNTEEWCPVTIGGTYVNESEELIINGKNMGIDLPKDILKAIYQTSFYNETPDTTIYNDKIKEILIAYNHIKMEAGNFESAIDSLKWFGYGKHITISKLLQTDTQFLSQYIRDYFNTSSDLIYSYHTFRNSTMIALTIPENADTEDLDPQDFNKEWFIGENKPILEDLFHKVVEKRYDERDITFYKPYYNFIFDELGLKLACLKYYYEKFFLPIHISVHSATIAHKVYANDIKLIQTTHVKTCNPPVLTADPNISVSFPVENVRYIYNHQLYVDDNYNEFSTTYNVGAYTESLTYYINDVCIDVPIKFRSTEMEQYYDCVLILRKEDKQIYESHFEFTQSQILDDKGNEKVVNEYLKFVIVPKIINTSFNINYWIDKKYQICLLVNGNWYYYDFVIKLPEFKLNFGKLIYRYNISDGRDHKYELKETDAEYVSPDDPSYYPGINERTIKAEFLNYFRQINNISDNGVDFNSFMFVPSLVEINDINFLANIRKRIQWTKEETEREIDNYRASQIQISDIKFPLPSNNDYYAYNDIINGYYRLSVEETSQIKKLTLIYRAFLNWNDYLEYMKAMRSIGLDNPEYKDKLNSIANELGIVYNCEVTYDFIENTIYYKYPEYNMGNLTDWYGTDEDGKIIENGIGPRTTFKWNYESKPILDPDTGEVIGEEIVADNTKYENLNYIIKENNQHMHYRLDRYVSTNAVFSYIRSNSTFSTFDLVLRDEIGHKIIENGYLGMSIHLIGELLNGSKFEKIKYAEPAIRNVEEEDKGDYCPFSELCNDCCANKCKYRRPTPVDRPKDDDGHYILADSFDRSIEQLEPKGEIDTNKTYSNIVKNSIESLIDKYRESPVIVDNTKYLNRIHMYHLYNENGDMIRYVDDSTYPDIILDSMNCHKKNMTYMNHVKGNPLEPNKEFFYQDLYKQPDELISFYRQFFWDNGEAKLTYPVDNYFDFDTYVMHDKDYWYVVFISTMTIDNILYQSDLTAKKEIEFKSELISDKYWHLSSGAYLGISDNIVYIMNDNHEYEKMIVDVDVNGNKVAADIHQITKINQTYYIYNNVTKEYLLDNDQINIDRYQAYWKYDEANREWIHRDSPVIEPVDISIIEDNNVYVYPVMYDVKVFQHVYEEIAYYNTEAEALAYIKKLKFTLKSQAEKYVDNLVDTERARYSIIREYNDIRKVYEYRIVYADTNINVFDDEEKDYFDTQLDAECKLDTILKAHKSRYNIVNELRNLYQYIYYDANTGQMLVEDAKYRKPVKANNYGTKLSNKYTLKWQRSSNQFLINRMYFIDSEGVNHFNNDDLIVASIDNVNFPFIFDTGTKWSFKPMSLGMLESSNVESNTNSAIMSIGNGNKKRIRGYYDVNVRYSVDAFMQHQYIKKARICID